MLLLKKELRQGNKGQILIEILIIIALFSILASGLALVSSVSGKAKTLAKIITQARGLNQQYREALVNISVNSWNDLDSLEKSSTTFYWLYPSSGRWYVTSGKEIFDIDQDRVERYFFIEKVWRTVPENLPTTTQTAKLDPATLKITIVTKVRDFNFKDEVFLSRWVNTAVFQSSWSGGPGVEGPINYFSNFFFTSTNINYGETEFKLAK